MSTSESEAAYEQFISKLPAPICQPQDCRHLDFAACVSVARLEDTGRFVAEVRVVCTHCREPFRFQGLQPGILHERPSCSIDGLEANLPIEPEIEKRLFGGARYEIPPKPESRH